jgi:transcriptional regulator with XRE-family HTH domain
VSVHPIGEKIKSFRASLGLTQLQLALRAGVSERTVRSAERGRPLKLEFLDFLATALGVGVREVVREQAEIASQLEWQHNAETLQEFLKRSLTAGEAADLVDLIHPEYETVFHFGSLRCGEILAKYPRRSGIDEARENIDFLHDLHSQIASRNARIGPAQGAGQLVVFRAEDCIQYRDGLTEFGHAVHLIEFEGRRIRRWTEFCVSGSMSAG